VGKTLQCKLKGKAGVKTNEYAQALATCRSLTGKGLLTPREVRFGDCFSETGVTARLNMELGICLAVAL